MLDVGTGSGAIALAIADEHPGAAVTAVDISADALELAAENAARTGIAIALVRHDLFLGLPRGPWDLIVTNPPYVDPADLPSLQPEVRDWEPHDALIADGAVEAVLRGAADVLASGGGVALEVGAGQAGATAIRLRDLGFGAVTITRDLAGIERVVEGVLSMSDADAVVRAVADGHLAILPTDTVYGLACTAFERQPAVDLYRLKGRSEIQPTALVAASIEALLECLPELRGGAERRSPVRCCRARSRSSCPIPPGGSPGSRREGRTRSASVCLPW